MWSTLQIRQQHASAPTLQPARTLETSAMVKPKQADTTCHLQRMQEATAQSQFAPHATKGDTLQCRLCQPPNIFPNSMQHVPQKGSLKPAMLQRKNRMRERTMAAPRPGTAQTPVPRPNNMENTNTIDTPPDKEPPSLPSTTIQPTKASTKDLLGKCSIANAALVNKLMKQQGFKHCGNFPALWEGDFSKISNRATQSS